MVDINIPAMAIPQSPVGNLYVPKIEIPNFLDIQRAGQASAREDFVNQAAQQAMGGNQAALASMSAVDPQRAEALRAQLEKMPGTEVFNMKKQSEFMKNWLFQIVNADPAQAPIMYNAMLAQARQQGIDISKMPPEYSAEAAQGALNGLLTLDEALKAQGQAANAERAMREPAGGSGTEKERALETLRTVDPASREWQDAWYTWYVTGKTVFDPATGRQYTQRLEPSPELAAIAARMGYKTAGSGGTRVGEQVGESKADTVLREKLSKLEADYYAAEDKQATYQQNLDLLGSMLDNPNSVLDIGAINKLQKLFDEGGVVRGEDVALIKTTDGALGELNALKRDVSGEGKVSEGTRNKMRASLSVIRASFDRLKANTLAKYQERYRAAQEGKSPLATSPMTPYVPPGTAPAGSSVNGRIVPGVGSARSALRGGR